MLIVIKIEEYNFHFDLQERFVLYLVHCIFGNIHLIVEVQDNGHL
jgi:hypothetical protein